MKTTVYNKNLTIYRNCNEDDIKKIEQENGIKCGKMGFYNPRLSGSKKSALIRFSLIPTMVFKVTKGGYVKHPRLGAMQIYNEYIELVLKDAKDEMFRKELNPICVPFSKFKENLATYMNMICDNSEAEVEKTLREVDEVKTNGGCLEAIEGNFCFEFAGDDVIVSGGMIPYFISIDDYLYNLCFKTIKD